LKVRGKKVSCREEGTADQDFRERLLGLILEPLIINAGERRMRLVKRRIKKPPMGRVKERSKKRSGRERSWISKISETGNWWQGQTLKSNWKL